MSPLRQPQSPPRPACTRHRFALSGGAATTLHVLRLSRAHYSARVAVLTPPRRLAEWCARNGVEHALIGGFYVRADGVPLGLLRVDAEAKASRPFAEPWGAVRACVHVDDGEVALRSPIELPADPTGDLLQAGPMLVRAGIRLVDDGADPEGFSAGREQFDSDITVGRYPRAALGLSRDELIAVVCDGRAPGEAGLTLPELAEAMIGLGARDAINLDGGGSASLVAGGRLVNTPREESGTRIPGGRAIATALRFIPA